MPTIPRKTMTFEDGETYEDVPVFVNSLQEYNLFKQGAGVLEEPPRLKIEPREASSYGSGTRDVKRVFRSMVGIPSEFLESVAPLDAAVDFTKTAQDLYGEDFYELGLGQRMERVRTARATKATERAEEGKFTFDPTLEELEIIADKDGYTTATETTGGTIANVGSYLVGGIGLLNGMRRLATTSPSAFRAFARRNPNMSEFGGGVVAGVTTDQWLTNPNNASLTASLVDIPESAVFGMGEYLQAPDEDDSDLEKRLKLLLGNLPAEIVIGGILGVGSSYISNKYGKSIDDLTPEEIGEEGIQGLKRTKAEIAKGRTELSGDRTVSARKEQEQVFGQEGIISGLWQKFTQSRGFNTYAGQDAFEQSQQAARKYRNKAQHISSRLQKSINNLLTKVDDEGLVDKVYDALTSTKVTIKSADDTRSEEALVNFLNKEFGFSEDISKSVIESRRLIDEMSAELRNYAPTRAAKKTIDANIGVYLRRSYKKFEDPNYAPTEQARANAEQYFLKKFQENDAFRVEEARKKGKTIRPRTAGQLEAQAIRTVDDILGVGDISELTKRGSLKKIFKERKDIDQPVRELLGEVTDPEDLLILTVDKMSKFYERARFLDSMNKIGTEQKWLFNSIPSGMEGKLVKLQNTGDKKLDGKYTTPRMSKVIMNDEINLFGVSDKVVNPMYKNFLSLKGFGNKAATVFNWTTHMRNLMGAIQFGLANGTNPFRTGALSKTLLNNPEFVEGGNQHFGKTFQVLSNEAMRSGDETLEALHEKYLKLGIINTNVRIGDFRALINEGADASNVDNLMSTLSNKVSRGAEKLYMATDDYFKINAFNNELDFLKRAYKDTGRSLDSLEQEAADIVKNTMPNYDRVPPGIKALRNLPMGTFVSFPAEIIRTSYNIVKQGVKEIGSGNGVLAARGSLRLGGFTGTMIGFNQVSEMLSSKLGWSEDEKNAATTLTTTPWSGPENVRLWKKDEETGKIFYSDTKYLDSYNTIKEPLIAAMMAFEEGRIDEDGFVEAGFKAVSEATQKLAVPFVSEAIVTKTITDVYYAMKSSEGETPEGRRIFNPNDSAIDRVGDAAYHILDSFIPGTVLGVDRLIRSADEERDPYTGELKFELDNEFVSFASGVRWSEWKPETSLNYKISEYNDNKKAITNVYPSHSIGFGDYVDNYRNKQKRRYEAQREIYKAIQASQHFRSDIDIKNQLIDRKIGKEEASYLMRGIFRPEEIDREDINEIMKMIGDAPEEGRNIRKELSDVYSDMSRTLLNTPNEED